MVRRVEDKSTGNVNVRFMNAFNGLILDTEMRELHRSGSRYTWSNMQTTPIQNVLDMIFVTNPWEDRYNLVKVQVITRIGSDHNPLFLNISSEQVPHPRYLKFYPSWLKQSGFRNWVIESCPDKYKHKVLDHWHIVSRKLRSAMKGWGMNYESERKK